jgi:5-methylcytosine-specific restriction endonuclease McrA
MTRRRAATVRGRGYRWRQVRRIALGIHVQLYGWTCPGWGVPAHHSYDLTGDHALPLAAGGLSTPANVTVLCRSCNSRKGSAVVREQLVLGLRELRGEGQGGDFGETTRTGPSARSPREKPGSVP